MGKKIVSILLATVIMASLVTGCGQGADEEEAPEAGFVAVETLAAGFGSLENSVTINGRVAASEEISVMPKAMGTVSSLNVRLGDQVQAGDVLFVIEQEDMNFAVAQAANGVELARKSVAQAENGLSTARINYEINKAQIENALLNLERTRKLYEEGAVSKAQLEQAELGANELNLDALRAQITQAEIGYQQALNQLSQAQISYQQAQSGLGNTVVESPMTGVVSALNVKQGQMAPSGQPAATIVNLDTIYIRINVVESVVNRLEPGQTVQISVPSAFEGYVDSVIDFVSPSADPMNRLYEVRIYVNNADHGIRSGMTGSVKLDLDKVDNVIVIPSSAVLDKDGRKIAYIVQEDLAVEREVEIGLDTGEHVEILSGISEGDSVIVEGQHYVADGAGVRIVRGE